MPAGLSSKHPFPLHLLCSERFKRCLVVKVVRYLKRTVVGFIIEAGYITMCVSWQPSQTAARAKLMCVCFVRVRISFTGTLKK